MYLAHDSILRPAPPPLWFVTNGDAVVGPVSTNLLLRGIAYDRVPLDCLVRERRWTSWRAMASIREIAVLRRDKQRYGTVEVPLARYRRPGVHRDPHTESMRRALANAQDPGEALLLCLSESVKQTGALVGAIHRCRPPYVGFVTSCATGPGMHGRLGQLLSADDPVVALAQRGQVMCSEPEDLISTTVQRRLGSLPACAGVAMLPIRCAGRLYAVLELGRPDHPFRLSDVARVGRIVGAAANRFAIVSNRWQLG